MSAIRLRIARHTDRLDEMLAFYRDRVGLTQSGAFTGHDGYDGVFLDIPGTATQLELTAGGAHDAPVPHPESLLVLFFDDAAARDAAAQRIGDGEVVPANPYWQTYARAFTDPDGFQVLLAVR